MDTTSDKPSRRDFLRRSGLSAVALSVTPPYTLDPAALERTITRTLDEVDVRLRVNGQDLSTRLEPRVPLLDALREHLGLTGTKKGCGHGHCGACTVHLDGERVLSCLTLAVAAQGKEITTIEGIASADGSLHPVQEAMIRHDGFQCGYCTSGQIMSGIACIREGHTGSRSEIKEWMSGNLCRCGAYSNIVDAIEEVNEQTR